jgi:DNA-binding PadR family transcriptional regulator
VSRTRKLSPQTLAVLAVLAADPGSWRYGYDLLGQTGLQAGSLYPILMRLAERGQVESRWEPGSRPGRPPRHVYRLTAAGLALAPAARGAARPAAAGAARRPQPGGAR